MLQCKSTTKFLTLRLIGENAKLTVSRDPVDTGYSTRNAINCHCTPLFKIGYMLQLWDACCGRKYCVRIKKRGSMGENSRTY
jgi:hypothetical protein